MQPNQQQSGYWQSPDDPQEVPLPDVSTPQEAESKIPFETLSWQASEYVHHEKQTGWFVGLTLISLILIVLSVFVIQNWSFTVLVVVMAIAISYLALRPPHIIKYQLSPDGLQVDDKHFSIHDFRSFGILNEGPLYSVILTPNKRFMPRVTMYFPPEMGEAIVDLLGALVPIEPIELDPIDRLVRKLRF